MRYRVIRDGETINTVELDSVWVKPSPLIAVEVQVTGSGWGGVSNAPAILAGSGGGQGGLKWQPPEGCTLEPIEDEPETELDPEALEATRLMHEAMALLSQTDFVVIKATEKNRTLSPDWLTWRDELRAIVATRTGVIREEPGRYATPAPEPEPHNFPANMSDKLVDWETAARLTTAALTEDVREKLTAAKRRKFTELLNVELAELQQERGGPREDLEREAEIEKLLGLFARVGEM